MAEESGVEGMASETKFGQRRPPLTELIKNILNRYPDGGQILKELIQNADDAGATEVRFLYDYRSFDTQYLDFPDLEKFQGPAFYAYNNAKFKPEDWEGIQNLMKSNKKNDPLKVGQFGIGFNSVYHITDLPGIVSGDTIGFLDPHEMHFGPRQSGKQYKISDGSLNTTFRDQLAPFQGIYNCDLAQGKSYDSTLFRFPLRTEPSKLSEKKYTKEMIDGLFESLRKEASVILLFLKSVQSISVDERREDDGSIECVFKVEVSEETREDVRKERQQLLDKALDRNVITESKYLIDVRVTSGSETTNHRWIVLNQIGSVEEHVTTLATKLRLLPWVGCAIPISSEAIDESAGRIFCFLPLPPDVDCKTGLPVHLHGYFGVTDNRRGLVWPGGDCQNNETAEWNELLVKKVGTTVYGKILEALIKDEPRTGLTEEQRCQLVYSVLPDLNKVRGHWTCILEPLFKEVLIDQKLFYCQSSSGSSWITLKEGILDRLEKSVTSLEARNTILRTLVDNGLVIVTDLPKHVKEIVDEYFGKQQVINPARARDVLKNPAAKLPSWKKKMLLLDYVLSDSPTDDLSGVPLLPLEGGEFTTFRPHSHASHPSGSVFVPSGNCKAALLPNMSTRFLDKSLSGETARKLYALAATEITKQNSTQLVKLTKDIVVKNLHASLPSKWSRVIQNGRVDKVEWTPNYFKHPSEKWLEDIWRWIYDSYPDSLELFRKIPLLPLPTTTTTTTNRWLGILSQDSKFIYASDSSGDKLPPVVIGLLTGSGCTVVSEPPPYLCHPDIHSYIASSTPAGTMTVLTRASLKTVQEYIKQTLTADNHGSLRKFLSRLPKCLPPAQEKFLLQLPLFDTLIGSSTAVQVNGEPLPAASSEFIPPNGFQLARSDQIISSVDPNACQLLNLLNVKILKPAEVFLLYLFPDIQAKTVYDAEETSRIMFWILEQMFTLKTQCVGFQEQVKILSFVPTDKGKLKKPSELYDPNDVLLVDLFLGETTKFPTGDFANENVVPELKELGLRKRDMLTAAELLEVAVNITSDPVSQTHISKAKALVKILEDNSVYLYQCVDESVTLKDKLLRLKWLPCAKHSPKDTRFPEFMSWYNSNSSFFSPTELRSKSQVLLVGSSMPILDAEMSEELQNKLGLTSDPPLHQVVSQLEIAVRSWQEQHQRKGSSQLEEMLIAIYLHLSQIPNESVSAAINNAALKQWIWQGTGFCSPPQLALEQDFPLDLRPQFFLLPEVLNDIPSLKQFFLSHGVRERFFEGDILGVLGDIKNKHEKLPPEVNASGEVERDLKLCRSILEWVVQDGETLEESLQEKVLVPVQNAGDGLVLEPCKKCTFCDQDWLRCGGSELDIPEDYSLIHESVPVKVARLLGVPALSTCLVSAETLGFEFEQTGPHEPITTRLNNILKEYKEGVGVFKELIQNADDAGASKVRFLVDWRHGPKQKLLSPKMAECQGPALWAYNNAVFTDKDFENINKLAGATKVEDLAKVGRFGLGFNAVYHLTDVPSFVSRKYFVMFDPNVHHLQSHIQDKSRPGIRINLAVNPRPLSAFEDQFQPYHDIFDCDTQCAEGEKFNCNGTLFRFPFRTLRQASESEICQSVYNEEKVKEIVSSLKDSASLLLLYTQHVNDVELYELEADNTPNMMQLVLSIKKNVPQDMRSGASSAVVPFIQECSDWWRGQVTSEGSVGASPRRLERLTIDVNEMASNIVGETKKSVQRETWLVSSCGGTGSSTRLALNEGRDHGLLPCAAAAAKLSNIPGNQSMNACVKLIPEAVSGEAFCFLPLSIATGFPVHINGYFAITSNRRGIWERSTAEHTLPIEVQWNESLMEDALTRAYLQLLEEVKRLSGEEYFQYDLHQKLWPCYDEMQSKTWGTLVKSYYTRLVEEHLRLFWSNGQWLDIHSGYVLDDVLSNVPGIRETLILLKKNVFHLTPQVRNSFERSGQAETLQNRTLTLGNFLEEFFFPNITAIPQKWRDPIVCFALDCISQGQKEFEALFQENACITCSEDKVQLAKACELISPKGAAAGLFSVEDNRFPVGEDFLTSNRLCVLEQLGMVKDELSWNDICERAKSVEICAEANYEKGRERGKNLIKYLTGNIEKLEEKQKADHATLEILQTTRFLPFIWKPPQGYTLAWKGSQHAANQLFTATDLFLPRDEKLIGSCCLIVNDSDESGCGRLGKKVKALLGFPERRPRNDQVLQQLDFAINEEANRSQAESNESLTESVCKMVYKHLNAFVMKKASEGPDVEKLLQELRGKPWLYIQGRFVSSNIVAFNWKENGAPYLYGLPNDHEYRKYKSLLDAAGVKESFEAMDFINALNILSESKGGTILDEDEIKMTVSFVSELQKGVNEDDFGEIPLPDSNGVLHRSKELTIKEPFWLQDRGDARYVHKSIPPQLAQDLGAKLLLDRRRDNYSRPLISKAFGQHEELTDRLKNILKSYPCDSGILKELVQNADDAKATEIHFVYDNRVLPHERVVQHHAEEIQGPALCVYNNRPFSDHDLEGIQKLGVGSKSDNPEKIGQYGIGFNAVYHLTDCPSFLSNGDTLCLLDPHCHYAAGATSESPGEMFQPIDDEFKEDFSHSLCGYDLGEHFPLKGATVFRLPLRTDEQTHDYRISKVDVKPSDIRKLLNVFKTEAKKMLLFLNYVKKISLSVIDCQGQFNEEYCVESRVEEESEKKRVEMASLIKEYKDQPTNEIPRKDATYFMTLLDSKKVVEEWLIHQCCGATCEEGNGDNTIPDGRSLGLFPRGGVAALVSHDSPPFTPTVQHQYVAYCFLPLPTVNTLLPVHINGHFALNPSRRDLWKDDPHYRGPLTKWNDFVKSRVIAPGYAALITEARNYIPHCIHIDRNNQYYFKNRKDAEAGLKWYHDIFPNPVNNPAWNILAIEVYRCLGSKEAPVLPVVVFDEERGLVKTDIQVRKPNTRTHGKKTRSSGHVAHSKIQTTANATRMIPQSSEIRPKYAVSLSLPHKIRESARVLQTTCTKAERFSEFSRRRLGTSSEALARIYKWLPAQKVFFTDTNKLNHLLDLFSVLLRVDMPLLLYSPRLIHDAFKEAGVIEHSRLVRPANVIEFLRTSQSDNPKCKIGDLPKALEDTNIRSISDLHRLISYCKEEKTFSVLLQGLPLLLTADGQLRVFDSDKPVYCSSFCDLFPAKHDRFVHPEFVDTLRRKNDDEPLPPVMLDLTVCSLASFLNLPDVFPPELIGCTTHVSLEFRKDGVLSETWFKRLWEFLEKYAKPEQNEASLSLEPLRELPIIPTVCGKLVTIGKAKSVLDMSKRVAGYDSVEKIREILKRLDCPILRVEITKSFLVEPELSTRLLVLDTYVAHPQSAVDILHVLEYMNTTRVLDAAKVSAEDICVLLMYFQNGVRDTCWNQLKILKALPFYKAIDDSLYALSEYIFYVTVPCGIPTTEMSRLQNKVGKTCLFLHPDGSSLLGGLYKMLGVETTCNVCEFYKKYVLPHFYIFSREFQIECLTHIKDWLRRFLSSTHEFFAFLRSIPCIPDEGGKLHCASDFYHPKNKVFQIMLDPNRNHFLSAPFDQGAWLKFLVKIGFNENVGEEQFLRFCRIVERNAQATSEDDKINRERSAVLVRYMFDHDNKHLHKPDFLTSVSNIQFISPEKVEPDLLSVHQQHQCDEANEKLQYVKFRNSVPWEHRKLVWTSAQLLPQWAQPRNLSSGADSEHLGVQEKPPIEIVITHLETISNVYAEVRKKAGVLPSLGKLKEVMGSIYDFLDLSRDCDETELSNSCSSACQTIGSRLKSVPCVFLEDENVLVEGEKLSFTIPPERSLKPFFYTVPREYGTYQHLLKRLGATEEVTSLQMANVLKALKDRCEDSKMCSDYEKIAGDAMFLLFRCVTTAEEKRASKISTLRELYLPSEAQILFKSNELVCNVPPHLVQTVATQKYNVLLPLEKCGLERGCESEYLEAIPERLRPQPLDHLVLEVLDPACRNERCLYLERNCCTFIDNYIALLKSTQFRYGLVRLMKHQKTLNELSDEEKEKAARFSSDKVKIECMKTIKTHLVYVKNQTPLGQNSGERTCYVTRESDSWTLYIQHEFGGKHTKAILSKAVKGILEGCVEDTSELADMLSCEMPSQIPGVLDAHDVSRDYSEDDDDLGREISAVYHYLMVQNPMCLFSEGARVAYGEDTSGDESGVDTSGDDTRRYILAKIIKRVGNLGKAGKTYDFQAEYRIDVGSDAKKVSVLDLYKFQEDDLVNSTEACEHNASIGPPIDVGKEKREIREALREAKALPLQKRLKVFRRLYLHWIRAKNSGKDEVATTEIIEFLSSEAEKIENEMDTTDGPTWPRFFDRCYWKNWQSQATREKEVFINFRSSYTGSGSYTRFSGTSDYVYPEPKEASRWIEQSQADLEAAGFLQSNIPPFYALVCFMSEQVAEKCLKAALYAKCGLRRDQLHTHDVYRLASSVCSLSDSPKDVVSLASSVASYYLPTRYPNQQPSFKVPANEYSKEDAEKALEAVNELLKSIKAFIDG